MSLWWRSRGVEHRDDAPQLLGVGPPIGHHLSGTHHTIRPPLTLQRHHLGSQRLYDKCGHLYCKLIVVST